MQLSEHETELLEMNANSEKLRLTYTELLEFKLVLLKVLLSLYYLHIYFLTSSKSKKGKSIHLSF